MQSIALAGLGLLLTGCGEETSGDAGDADTDVDTDADTDGDTDTGGVGDLLRLVYLDLQAPDALDNIIVEALINDNMDDYTLNWLIELGPPNGETCSYRSGAALPDEDSCTDCDTSGCGDCTAFIFETDYPPGTGDADCTDADFRVPEGDGVIDTVDIPVRGKPFIVLPLREAALSGAYGSSPDATGQIDAKITLEAAVGVEVEDMGQTLCALLSGDNGAPVDYKDDCLNILACDAGKTPPDDTWTCGDGNPPDTDVGGEPAWSLTGQYEADWADLGT